MRWLRAIASEVYGLFVDDGQYALTIILWVILAAFALPRLHLSGWWEGVILFAGLAAILLESTARRADRDGL